ncbi:hypothetical protein A9Q96_06795 [Rhodobacterales bacterium 52_120_T64]|nr:hypothetical protein A9Q96_06795 [Rhodobacterales bacterium 52_120_T64]
MYIQPASPVPFGAILALNVVNFVDNSIANVVAWNASRKTAAALSKLTVSQLEDIGLLPGDTRSHY